MDSSSTRLDLAITPYLGASERVEESLVSSARTSPLNNGDFVKLFIQGYGEVGARSVVEARPVGEWLGVAIPLQPWVFVLVRPENIVDDVKQLTLFSNQRGLRVLTDVLQRTMLWNACDVEKSSGDLPMGGGSFILQED